MDYRANIKNHVIDDLMIEKRFVTQSSMKSVPYKITVQHSPSSELFT